MLDAVETTARDAASVDAGSWDPARLARLLEERLQAARLPDPEIGPRRVQVVGMLELRGIHPPWLWVGGLLADDFPARPPEDFLLSRTARAALDKLDPGDEARYLFASAIRNALAEGHALTLSWPATRDDRPVAVSPLLEDLLEVEIGGAALRKRVEAGVPPVVPAGPAELDALLGEAAAIGADAPAWAVHVEAPARLARMRTVIQARRDPEGFGPWDGVLDRPPPPPGRLGVTRFEEYLACPSRYFHRALLGLAAEDTWDPDLGRPEQGRLLHGILDDFLQAVRGGGLTRLRLLDPAARGRWARVLHEVATARLDGDPVVSGLVASLAGWHRQRWLAGLVDDAPKGLLAAWLDSEIVSELPTVLDQTELPFNGHRVGPLTLEGRVDRVDRLADGAALVIDYKTGRAPAAR
ncbi:MAG: PD-(D/E)XK nuclease family protein, partial [Myxococcota bacterium]